MPVLVAGSTRDPEEAEILDAFRAVRRRFPSALLILAPRHVERAPRIRTLAERKGFSCQLRTALDPSANPRQAPVVILDTMGELSAAYSVASVVFCGGSLVPLGGQNPLEAAAWGKPVLYGPSMEDFTDARTLLESTGGGIPVTNGGELTRKVLELLSNPEHGPHRGPRSEARRVPARRGRGQTCGGHRPVVGPSVRKTRDEPPGPLQSFLSDPWPVASSTVRHSFPLGDTCLRRPADSSMGTCTKWLFQWATIMSVFPAIPA